MKSINRFMALILCLFVGTSMLLVASAGAAEDPNYYYYSGIDDDVDRIMYMVWNFENCSTATLSFSTRYDNKPGDFALAFCSPNVTSNLIGKEYLNGTTHSEWETIEYNIYSLINVGEENYIGFNYQTDNISNGGEGFYVDNIVITVDGNTILDDNGTNESWIMDNFTRYNDTKPPDINKPEDIQIEKGGSGSIIWTITEIFPDKYWVLKNSTEVNSTEVIPPSNYKDKAELTVPINTSELGIWNYTIFANDTSGNNASDQVKITVKKPIVDDRKNGGGGGGGGGTSGEAFNNIEVSETEREYVNKDSKVSYSFDMEGNIISYINFTGKTSSGRIAAKIDTLKDTSTLVDHAPQGKVFKNMGIYVGNLGWASPNNIANPTIRFIVHKSWVNENNIDKSTITLNRYSDEKWNPLETDLIDEDQDSLYFESKTPGFSQFAVTGTEASAAQGGEGEVVEKPTIVVERQEPVTEQTPDEKDTGIPGFSLLTGFTIMLVVVQLLRRKK
ncbi:MAG: PGF-pre-PGF domain-containing protein [Methanosarcinales archaeon]|nr:PGF-pre-PGF domain-containing protein [Methanosarcinales archaeon]